MTIFKNSIALICGLFILCPLVLGLGGLLLPSFGIFPALGLYELSWQPMSLFWHQPQTQKAIQSAFMIGLVSTALSVGAVFILMAIGDHYKGALVFRFYRFLIGPLIALPHSTIAIALLFLGSLLVACPPDIT